MATALRVDRLEFVTPPACGALNHTTSIEDDKVVLTLNDNGTIRECNEAGSRIFGCPPSKLIWQHISTFLPQLAGVALMQGEQINPRLRFLSHIGHQFEVIGKGGARFACAIFLSEVENVGLHYVRVILSPIMGGMRLSLQ